MLLEIIASLFISVAWADGPPTPPPPPPPTRDDVFNKGIDPGVVVWAPGMHRRMTPGFVQPGGLPHPNSPDAASGHFPGK